MSIEEKYIKNVSSLVPCPEIALEVLRTAHDDECDITQLANKIEQDPNLTANMLRLANSAYFGHMKKITSIQNIIVRLGLESVKLIAITSASVGILKSPQKAYNLEPGSLWQHSFATAVLSKIIGRHANSKDISTLYTAALLHDVGKVILNRPLQAEIYNQTDRHIPSNSIHFEQSTLHTDHAKVGMVLLKSWGLPGKITIPVGFHHRSDEAKQQKLATRIVHLSNSIVETMGFHSTSQDIEIFDSQEYLEQQQDLPQIPNFQENIEDIISEFYENYNETSTLLMEI